MHKPIPHNGHSKRESVTSPWRFGIVLRRPRTWQLSSRDDSGVSLALVAVLFAEIQPKSMQLVRDRARLHTQRLPRTRARYQTTKSAEPSEAREERIQRRDASRL